MTAYDDELKRILAFANQGPRVREALRQQLAAEHEQRRLAAQLYNQPSRRLVNLEAKCQLPECDEPQQRDVVYCVTHQSNLESWLEAREKRLHELAH
jgi:hypothetical protein